MDSGSPMQMRPRQEHSFADFVSPEKPKENKELQFSWMQMPGLQACKLMVGYSPLSARYGLRPCS
jgi:hypothetical protein